MGHWDELCLICGVSPIPPCEIYTDTSFGAEDLVEKLHEHNFLPSSDPEENAELISRLESVLESGAEAIQDDPGRVFFEQPLAIGHFHPGFDGDVPSRIVPYKNEGGGTQKQRYKRLILSGRNIEVRLAAEPMCGEFESSLCTDKETGKQEWVTDIVRTSASNYLYPKLNGETSFGNFWVTNGCWAYLQAWVCLPRKKVKERAGKALARCEGRGDMDEVEEEEDAPLSLAEEFYEVINSRQEGRAPSGTLVGIDYEGTDGVLEQTQYELCHGLDKPAELAKALKDEEDDDELVEAILRDCGFWRFTSPQIWPELDRSGDDAELLATETMLAVPVRRQITETAGHILTLPLELLDTFLLALHSLQDYFSLAQTCTSLYNSLTDGARINRIFRGMSSWNNPNPHHPLGCLAWIRPLTPSVPQFSVDNSPDEIVIAQKAFKTWLPENHISHMDQSEGQMIYLDDPEFPWLSFVKACFTNSDSMRNRRRLWRQVKRVEEIWRDYRLNGWEVDRFITFEQAKPDNV